MTLVIQLQFNFTETEDYTYITIPHHLSKPTKMLTSFNDYITKTIFL